MSKIYNNVTELVGGTPLIELQNIEKEKSLRARLLAKPELFNPGGSAKDRVALHMLRTALSDGSLTSDSVIIEPTSGNTGIGLALTAAVQGYRAIIVMPDTMSVERQKLMAAYGAELVLSDGRLGMTGAIEKARQLASEIPNSMIAGQFVNPANAEAHYLTTGPEIYNDTDGEVDIFVAGVGTGGTITGVGKYLKEKRPDVRIVAVEPADSPVLTGGAPGGHKLQGIGAGFVPEILDTHIYDEVITVTTEQAYEGARTLCRKEGLLVGISSGAAFSAALTVASRPENQGKTVVVLLPDTGERYLSTDLF